MMARPSMDAVFMYEEPLIILYDVKIRHGIPAEPGRG